jgi:hypothetical protein
MFALWANICYEKIIQYRSAEGEALHEYAIA